MEPITQQSIKWTHTNAVFRAITEFCSEREAFPVSRADIAEKTTLSLMTVGKIVDRLVDFGVLVQNKEQHSSAGRRTRLVCCDSSWYSLVLDLTSRNFRITVLNLYMHVIDEMVYPYDDAMYCEENLLLFLKNLPMWMNISDQTEHCIGIGVLLPGTYDSENDRILNARVPELAPIHPRALIAAHFSQTPIHFIQDLRAAAVSAMEHASDSPSVRLWLSLGHPVNGLLLTETGPLFGANGLAGRFGEITVGNGLSLNDAISALSDRRELAEAVGSVLKSLTAIFDPKEIILEASRLSLDDEFIDILRDYLKPSSPRFPAPTLTVSDKLLGHARRGIAILLREKWLKHITDTAAE
ncbi:MAG: ROK family protein [Clostridia bacterium]|nr:ROK family protein [Clostridia bacterium]